MSFQKPTPRNDPDYNNPNPAQPLPGRATSEQPVRRPARAFANPRGFDQRRRNLPYNPSGSTLDTQPQVAVAAPAKVINPYDEELKGLRKQQSLVKTILDGRKQQAEAYLTGDGADLLDEVDNEPVIRFDEEQGRFIDYEEQFPSSQKRTPIEIKARQAKKQQYRNILEEQQQYQATYDGMTIQEGKLAESSLGFTQPAPVVETPLQPEAEAGAPEIGSPEWYQAVDDHGGVVGGAPKDPLGEQPYKGETVGADEAPRAGVAGHHRFVEGNDDGSATVRDVPLEEAGPLIKGQIEGIRAHRNELTERADSMPASSARRSVENKAASLDGEEQQAIEEFAQTGMDGESKFMLKERIDNMEQSGANPINIAATIQENRKAIEKALERENIQPEHKEFLSDQLRYLSASQSKFERQLTPEQRKELNPSIFGRIKAMVQSGASGASSYAYSGISGTARAADIKSQWIDDTFFGDSYAQGEGMFPAIARLTAELSGDSESFGLSEVENARLENQVAGVLLGQMPVQIALMVNTGRAKTVQGISKVLAYVNATKRGAGNAIMFGSMFSEQISDAEQTMGQKFDEMPQDDRNDIAKAAFASAAVNMAIERASLNVLGSKILGNKKGIPTEELIDKLTKGSVWKQIVGGFIAEGETEAVQSYVTDKMAQFFYDEDRDLWDAESIDERFKMFIIGGIAGGITKPLLDKVGEISKEGKGELPPEVQQIIDGIQNATEPPKSTVTGTTTSTVDGETTTEQHGEASQDASQESSAPESQSGTTEREANQEPATEDEDAIPETPLKKWTFTDATGEEMESTKATLAEAKADVESFGFEPVMSKIKNEPVAAEPKPAAANEGSKPEAKLPTAGGNAVDATDTASANDSDAAGRGQAGTKSNKPAPTQKLAPADKKRARALNYVEAAGVSAKEEIYKDHPDVKAAVQVVKAMKASKKALRPIADIFNTAQKFAADRGSSASVEVLPKAEFTKLATEQGAPALADRAAINYMKDGKIVVAFNADYKHASDNDLVATATHESFHSVGRLLDEAGQDGAPSFLQTEWQKLSPEQRRKASKQYGSDFDTTSDADLANSHAARHEWFAFQGFRALKGEVSEQQLAKDYGQDFASKVTEFVKQFREVLQKWVGTADVSTKELDAAISNILGAYSPNAVVAEKVIAPEAKTESVKQPSSKQPAPAKAERSIPKILQENFEDWEKHGKSDGENVATFWARLDSILEGYRIEFDEGKSKEGEITKEVLTQAKTITAKQEKSDRGGYTAYWYYIFANSEDGTTAQGRETAPYKATNYIPEWQGGNSIDSQEISKRQKEARLGARIERDLKLWILRTLKDEYQAAAPAAPKEPNWVSKFLDPTLTESQLKQGLEQANTYLEGATRANNRDKTPQSKSRLESAQRRVDNIKDALANLGEDRKGSNDTKSEAGIAQLLATSVYNSLPAESKKTSSVKDFLPYGEKFAKAFKAKDADFMLRLLAQGRDSNKGSKKVFFKLIEKKLPKNIAGISHAIDVWAGISPEQRADIDANAEGKRKAEADAKDKERLIDRLESEKTRRDGGPEINKVEFIDSVIKDGFNQLENVSTGAVPKYALSDGNGNGFNIKGDEVTYARIRLEELGPFEASEEENLPFDADVARLFNADGSIGVNSEGKKLWQDPATGVRSLEATGSIRESESVSIVPTRDAGAKIVQNPREDKFKTTEELAEAKAEAKAPAKKIAPKPAPAPEASGLSDAGKALGDALEGLFSPEEVTQKGIPFATLGKLEPTIKILIEEDNRTQADIVTLLDEIAVAQGKPKAARVLADSLYSVFRAVDPTLPQADDWAEVFAAVDNEQQTTEVNQEKQNNEDSKDTTGTSELDSQGSSGNDRVGTGRGGKGSGNDAGLLEGKSPEDAGTTESAESTQEPSESAGTESDGTSRKPTRNDAKDGLGGTSGEGVVSDGAGDGGQSDGDRVDGGEQTRLPNYQITNPESLVGGGPKTKFKRNRLAIETYQTVLSENRQPTEAERDAIASYIGWGSFGQELFNGDWARKRPKEGWETEDKWLRDHLGQSEWESAQSSIINAHYTDPPTVTAMWDMVRKMGFKGGRVLEPAMGIGNFFGLMPTDLRVKSELTGIELDELTGGMAQMLYPRSNISVMGYEKSQTPDNFYDLVVGNWPFAAQAPSDRRYNKLNPTLHDYFFLKALDQVRAGGLVIGITSSGTMDKSGQASRLEMSKKADLVASFRLPTGAFGKYAGTAVVTDIIILRKKPEQTALEAIPTWVQTTNVKTPAGPEIRVNQFYADNPKNVLGTLDFGNGTTFGRAGMIVTRKRTFGSRLTKLAEEVKPGEYHERAKIDTTRYVSNNAADRLNSVLVGDDGELYISRGERMALLEDVVAIRIKSEKETQARFTQLKDLVGIKKLLGQVVDAQREGDENTEELRKELREAYENFTEAHGLINKSKALQYLGKASDPSFAQLASLEYNEEQVRANPPNYRPSTILYRSTMRSKPKSENLGTNDAYLFQRNEGMEIDLDRIAELSNKTTEAVTAELVESGVLYKTPIGGYEHADIYLSGNVREKLRDAISSKEDGVEGMDQNIEALKKVVPDDIPYFNIEAKLGNNWTSAAHYKQFVSDMLALNEAERESIEVGMGPQGWKVKFNDRSTNHKPEATTQWGVPDYAFSKLVQSAMNNATITIRSKDMNGNLVVDEKASATANEKSTILREHFTEWAWKDAERKIELEKNYNEVFNSVALPSYNGDFLALEGMMLERGESPFNLRSHQRNAIARGVISGRGIYAHEVGTGKTYTMAGIAIESRRYGKAKKPLIFAHNANSATVAREFNEMYPGAKILYVGDFTAKDRAIKLAQIQNDDWDAVVVPHSMIDKFALRDETYAALAAEEIAELEAAAHEAAEEDGVSAEDLEEAMEDSERDKKSKLMLRLRSPRAKEMVKARNRIKERILRMSQKSSEDAIRLEDAGVDMIIVDEAHEFKKPPIATKMQMRGLNTQASDRSVNMMFLLNYVSGINNGKGVHLFTGTPITNTLNEIYNMMRFVMGDVMKRDGVAHWDAWFNTFADQNTDVEVTAAGEYEAVTRLSSFVNVPELRLMVGQYMDTVFADDMPEFIPRETANGKNMASADITTAEKLELTEGRSENPQGRPYKIIKTVVAEMSPQQKEIRSLLARRTKTFKNASKKQRKTIMDKGYPESPVIVETDASNAGLDARLFDLTLPDYEKSKIHAAVDNLVEIYNSHEKAGQVVFMERGFSDWGKKSLGRDPDTGQKRFEKIPKHNVVKDLIEKLVLKGIPREEIAIVDGKTTKLNRKKIADMVNSGEIRIVIGQTGTLGTGVNMQENLRAMHHLDAPWRPGDLEQRNGRGHRQGNKWNSVLEMRYVTEGIDGRRWQVLVIKDRFIKSFLRADGTERIIEGDAADTDDAGSNDMLSTLSEATGDPRLLQIGKAQKDIEKLNRRERLHSEGVVDAKRKVRQLYAANEYSRSGLEEVTEDIAFYKAEKEKQGEDFSIQVGKKTYKNRKKVDAAFEALFQTLPEYESRKRGKKFGTFLGFDLYGSMVMNASTPFPSVNIIGPSGRDYSFKGTLASLEATMRLIPKQEAHYATQIADNNASITNLEKASAEPFAQAKKLEQKTKLLESLLQDLQMNPVPAPSWLRQPTPVGSLIVVDGKQREVTGHLWSARGWFVMVQDANGEQEPINYTEVKDDQGLEVYEEKEFVAPEIISAEADAEAEGAAPAAGTPSSADILADSLIAGAKAMTPSVSSLLDPALSKTPTYMKLVAKEAEVVAAIEEYEAGGDEHPEIKKAEKRFDNQEAVAVEEDDSGVDEGYKYEVVAGVFSKSLEDVGAVLQERLNKLTKQRKAIELKRLVQAKDGRLDNAGYGQTQHDNADRGLAAPAEPRTLTKRERNRDKLYLDAVKKGKTAMVNTLFNQAAKEAATPQAQSGYANVSDSLMGYTGDTKAPTGYSESNYSKEITVVVKFADGTKDLVDGMKGLNVPHAMERAKRNWPAGEVLFAGDTPAESVVRDAGGNVIPLSERFAPTTPTPPKGGKPLSKQEKRVKLLQAQIDKSYSKGDFDRAEKLDVKLEELLDSIENKATELEVSREEVDYGQLDSDNFEYDAAEPDQESELVNLLNRWNKPNSLESEDYPSFGAFARASTWGIKEGVTDEQIEEAANEALKDYERRRNNFKSKALGAPSEQTKTPKFKKWFGKSKVVDENGEPMISYHGTNRGIIRFDTRGESVKRLNNHPSRVMGSFFTNSEILGGFYAKGAASKYGGVAITDAVYLSIQNPKRFERSEFYKRYDGFKDNDFEAKEALARADVEKFKAEGYDGIIVEDGLEIIAFEPTQIKSATDNSGEFDASNPSILAAPKEVKGSDAQEAIRKNTTTDMVDRRTMRMRMADFYKANMADAKSRFLMANVDGFQRVEHAFDATAGKGASASTDAVYSPIKAFHATRHISAHYDSWMTVGATKILPSGAFDEVEGSEGLYPILGDLIVNHEDHTLLWESYVTAVRADVLLEQGREHNFGFDREGYAEAIAAGEDVQKSDFWSKERAREEIDEVLKLKEKYPFFEDVRLRYLKWNSALLDFAEGSGVINPSERAKWDEDVYVPFNRVRENAEELAKELQGPNAPKTAKDAAKLIRRLKGGDGRVAVMESISENFKGLMQESLNNIAKRTMTDAFGSNTLFLEKAKHVPTPFKIAKEEIIERLAHQRYLELLATNELPPKTHGSIKRFVNMAKSAAAAGQYDLLGVADEAELTRQITFWRMKAPQGKDIMTVMVGGKPQYWQIKDKLLMESIEAIGPDAWKSGLRKFLYPFNLAKRALTFAITIEPSFIAANGSREAFIAWVTNQEILVPGISSAKEAALMLTKDRLQGRLKGAGFGSTSHDAVRDASLSSKDVRKGVLAMSKNVRKGFFRSIAATPKQLWTGYEHLVAMSENASRLAVARVIDAKGGSMQEAAYQAHDQTNFQAHGNSEIMRVLVHITPFLNSSMQGMYRTARQSATFAKSAESRRQRISFTTKAAILAGASIGLLAINWDDEEYWKLPEWDRNNYWHFNPGTTSHIRVPKPFEVGALFGTIPEAIFTGMRGKEDVNEVLGKMLRIMAGASPSLPLPQGAKQVLELEMNKNIFTGMPIVNPWALNDVPEEQYSLRTSVTLREIAEAMPRSAPEWTRSPNKLEHVYRGMTGTLGAYVMDTADVVTRRAFDYPSAPKTAFRDGPILKNVFARYAPSTTPRSSSYVTEFYKLAQSTDKLMKSIEHELKAGNVEEVRELKEENAHEIAMAPMLKKLRPRLSKIKKQIDNVKSSRSLSPEAKRTRIDTLIVQRNDLTETAVKRFKAPRALR